MVKIWVMNIMNGRKSVEDIPAKLEEKVLAALAEAGYFDEQDEALDEGGEQ